MPDIPTPPWRNLFVTKEDRLSKNWLDWFLELKRGVAAQSGPTSKRPIKNVSVGDCYFDTTLSIPVWLASIDSETGDIIWVGADGQQK